MSILMLLKGGFKAIGSSCGCQRQRYMHLSTDMRRRLQQSASASVCESDSESATDKYSRMNIPIKSDRNYSTSNKFTRNFSTTGSGSGRDTDMPLPSSSGVPLSPSEAGKMAFVQNQEMINTRAVSNNDESLDGEIVNMDTRLAHSGLRLSSTKKEKDGLNVNLNEPLCPPLHLESTYTRPPSGDYFNEEDGGRGWVYSRMGNPTRTLLEETLSDLEWEYGQNHKPNLRDEQSGEQHSVMTTAFSSGMAAAAAVILALPPPLHIILPDDIYHGVPSQLNRIFLERGVTTSKVDMTNLEQLAGEIDRIANKKDIDGGNLNIPLGAKKNILIWMESPSNPQCKVTDIRSVCDLIVDKSSNKNLNEIRTDNQIVLTTLVDSTWAPPCITQPLLLGADVVLHSGTKYLGGHSDVLLGSVTTSPSTTMGQTLGQEIRSIQTTLGSNASPFDCWLTLRGLRTLHLRVQRQSLNAMAMARWLSEQDLVCKVHYPGLKTHPQHDVATRQMKNGLYGGMLSFEMKDEATAMAVAGAVSVIKRATSLGGTETLIEHRASIEPEDGRVSPDGLLRVSAGLENIEDIKKDLSKAIKIAGNVANNV